MTKKESIEEAAKKYYENNIDKSNIVREHYEFEIQDLMIGFAYNWQKENESKKEIDFNKLREEFFNECVDFDLAIGFNGNEIFEWFKNKLNGNA